MIIKEPEHTENYAVMNNALLEDESLSWEARGVLAYLISRPADWNPSVSHIAAQGGIGRTKASRIFAELEEAGYLKKSQARTQGRFGTGERIIFENPGRASENKVVKLRDTVTQNPDAANPSTANPQTVNRDTVTGTLISTDLISTEKEISTEEEHMGLAPICGEQVATISAPYDDIVSLYNQMAGNEVPRCRKLTKARKARLLAMWREDLKTIVEWEAYFFRVQQSDFLMGRSGDGFRINLDWVIKPANHVKIIEGSFDENYQRAATKHKHAGSLHRTLTNDF